MVLFGAGLALGINWMMAVQLESQEEKYKKEIAVLKKQLGQRDSSHGDDEIGVWEELGRVRGRLERLEESSVPGKLQKGLSDLSLRFGALDEGYQLLRDRVVPSMRLDTESAAKRMARVEGALSAIGLDSSAMKDRILDLSKDVGRLTSTLEQSRNSASSAVESAKLEGAIEELIRQAKEYGQDIFVLRGKVASLELHVSNATTEGRKSATLRELSALEGRVNRLEIQGTSRSTDSDVGHVAASPSQDVRSDDGRSPALRSSLPSSSREGLKLTVQSAQVIGGQLRIKYLVESLKADVVVDTYPAVNGINYQPSTSRVVLSGGSTLKLNSSGLGDATGTWYGIMKMKLSPGVPIAFTMAYRGRISSTDSSCKLLEVSLRRNRGVSTKFSFRNLSITK